MKTTTKEAGELKAGDVLWRYNMALPVVAVERCEMTVGKHKLNVARVTHTDLETLTKRGTINLPVGNKVALCVS